MYATFCDSKVCILWCAMRVVCRKRQRLCCEVCLLGSTFTISTRSQLVSSDFGISGSYPPPPTPQEKKKRSLTFCFLLFVGIPSCCGSHDAPEFLAASWHGCSGCLIIAWHSFDTFHFFLYKRGIFCILNRALNLSVKFKFQAGWYLI